MRLGTRIAQFRWSAGLAIILALTATAIGSYGWRGGNKLDATTADDRLVIAASGPIGSCPLLMASNNGYLASEGITATFHFFGDGETALGQVFAGHANLAIVGEIPIMYAALESKPVSVVATVSTMTDHVILGRRDHGINHAADIKGKRIGVSRGNTTEFFLDAFLNRLRLSSNDVVAVDMKPPDLLKAIVRGELDAIAMYQPPASVAASKIGENAVLLSDDTVYDILVSLTTTRDYVAARQETLQKLLRAAIRGAQFCEDSPAEAVRTIAPISNADPALLMKLWPLYQFEVTLRQGLVLTLEDAARWAIKNRSTGATALPNFLNHVALAPLKNVSPLSVTVIH